TNSTGGLAAEVQTASSTSAAQCFVGLAGLGGAFTDSSGHVVQPLCIGNGPIEFTTPTGATQLQLGINTGRQADNTGSFVVDVSINGAPASPITVIGTSKIWDTSINPAYDYGEN